MDLETAARKRRERQRGAEEVDPSGMFMTRRAEDRKAGQGVLAFIAMANAYKPIYEEVEAARHLPISGANGETRAQRDDWLRGIRDACED